SAPEATSDRTRFEPMKPAPPVTKTVTSVPPRSSRREQFRVDRFHSAYRGSHVELSRAAPGGCPELRKQLRVAKKADDGARKRRGIAGWDEEPVLPVSDDLGEAADFGY